MQSHTMSRDAARIKCDLLDDDIRDLLDELKATIGKVKKNTDNIASDLKQGKEVKKSVLNDCMLAICDFERVLKKLEQLLLAKVDGSPNRNAASRTRDAVQNFWSVSAMYTKRVIISKPQMRSVKDILREFDECWRDLQYQHTLL